ncbi:MAG: metal ABC transporter ATP-binding protein [Oscillospiraceae bacterium]|nr:metal ABC transporter ATP-binding protein [Oscillospiraceae bacterium]
MIIQMNALEVEGLSVLYNKKPALQNVSFGVPQGVMCAVVGPNGAGKSTLLKALLGLVKTNGGKIKIFGSVKPDKKAIAYVPQTENIDWDFPITVFDMVMMGRYGSTKSIFIKKSTKQKNKAEAAKALKKVGMQSFANSQISELSGGQKQRVLLARALVRDSALYLMDEPFKGLDQKSSRILFDILKEMEQQNKTIIVVHHDCYTVQRYFGYVALVNKSLVSSGRVEDVFTEGNLKLTYAEE